MSFNVGWYLIYTRPRHERKVSEGLSEVSVKYYLPEIRSLRTWFDRKKYIQSPLFPSYIFVHLNDMKEYYRTLKVEGFLYYVKLGKEMVRVKDSIIDNIRLVVNQGSDIEVTNNCFQPGQKLVISDGPLTGLSAEVIQYGGKEKILVRVYLLQRNLLATLPTEYISAIGA